MDKEHLLQDRRVTGCSTKPLLPQLGDAGAGLRCQTLQPNPVSSQQGVSANHRGHSSSRDMLGLVSPQGAASDLPVGVQPLWELFGLLIGLSLP